ncbi:MAG: hypothetical protein AAB316_19880, partial [Bacteroidota bacterium]
MEKQFNPLLQDATGSKKLEPLPSKPQSVLEYEAAMQDLEEYRKRHSIAIRQAQRRRLNHKDMRKLEWEHEMKLMEKLF